MNIAKRMMAAAVAVLAMVAVSCEKEDSSLPVEEELEVTANNISGKWKLVSWNGAKLADGTYVYLDIVRNGRTYTMYQNIDSFSGVPHVVTGSYYIDTDPELGAVIRGNYDHDSGDWAHRYIVTYLTEDKMEWIAKDGETFVQVFLRVDSIPVAE